MPSSISRSRPRPWPRASAMSPGPAVFDAVVEPLADRDRRVIKVAGVVTDAALHCSDGSEVIDIEFAEDLFERGLGRLAPDGAAAQLVQLKPERLVLSNDVVVFGERLPAVAEGAEHGARRRAEWTEHGPHHGLGLVQRTEISEVEGEQRDRRQHQQNDGVARASAVVRGSQCSPGSVRHGQLWLEEKRTPFRASNSSSD